jgi:hypothetical protein
MKKTPKKIREIRERKQAEWDRIVKQGPKRWGILNRVAYPLVGVLLIPASVIAVVCGIYLIESGRGSESIVTIRGLPISPADEVVIGFIGLAACFAMIWRGLRYKRAQRGVLDDKSSS